MHPDCRECSHTVWMPIPAFCMSHPLAPHKAHLMLQACQASWQAAHVGMAPQPPANEFYFYQSSDGRWLFLHPLLMRVLLAHHSSYVGLPTSIHGPLVEVEPQMQTLALRKRHKFLGHLPLGGWSLDSCPVQALCHKHVPSQQRGAEKHFLGGTSLAPLLRAWPKWAGSSASMIELILKTCSSEIATPEVLMLSLCTEVGTRWHEIRLKHTIQQ